MAERRQLAFPESFNDDQSPNRDLHVDMSALLELRSQLLQGLAIRVVAEEPGGSGPTKAAGHGGNKPLFPNHRARPNLLDRKRIKLTNEVVGPIEQQIHAGR